MELKEFMIIAPIAIPLINALMMLVKQYDKLKKFIPVIAMVV
jgi:hypothetical protein